MVIGGEGSPGRSDDLEVKIILLGNYSVGKTSLLKLLARQGSHLSLLQEDCHQCSRSLESRSSSESCVKSGGLITPEKQAPMTPSSSDDEVGFQETVMSTPNVAASVSPQLLTPPRPSKSMNAIQNSPRSHSTPRTSSRSIPPPNSRTATWHSPTHSPFQSSRPSHSRSQSFHSTDSLHSPSQSFHSPRCSQSPSQHFHSVSSLHSPSQTFHSPRSPHSPSQPFHSTRSRSSSTTSSRSLSSYSSVSRWSLGSTSYCGSRTSSVCSLAPIPETRDAERDSGVFVESWTQPGGIVEVVFQHRDRRVLARIADTGGQERYRSMTTSYYRGAHGCLLMFDVTQEESFTSLDTWLESIQLYRSTEDFPIILVGTRSLSPDRRVPYDRAALYAANRELPYMELDLDHMSNVQGVFEALLDDVTTTLVRRDPAAITIYPHVCDAKSKNGVVRNRGVACSCG